MAEFTEEEIQETIKKLTSVIKGKPVDNSYTRRGLRFVKASMKAGANRKYFP